MTRARDDGHRKVRKGQDRLLGPPEGGHRGRLGHEPLPGHRSHDCRRRAGTTRRQGSAEAPVKPVSFALATGADRLRAAALLTAKLGFHLLGPLQLAHRPAPLVQDELVHPDEDAVLRFTAKVLYALHGAVVLPGGRVQLDANPGAAHTIQLENTALTLSTPSHKHLHPRH